MLDMTPFSIDFTNPTKPKVQIAGHDVAPECKSVAVNARANEIPEVWIQLVPGGVIEGEGIVRVVPDQGDLRESILEFLAGLDPALLEQSVLERDGEPFGVAALNVLREWLGAGA